MASIYDDNVMVPGFSDTVTKEQNTDSSNSQPVKHNNQGVVNTAWFIIIASLAALWLLGVTFR